MMQAAGVYETMLHGVTSQDAVFLTQHELLSGLTGSVFQTFDP
jgi:hypothetical protein